MSIYEMLRDDKIPASDIFLNIAFSRFLEDTTNNLLRRNRKGKVSISVVDNHPTEIAFTNGSKTIINYGCKVVQKPKDKYDQFRILRGLNGHELGHILYDDFALYKKIIKYFDINTLFPISNHLSILSNEQQETLEEIKHYLNDTVTKRSIIGIYDHFDNVLSDAFVNTQIIINLQEYRSELLFTLSLLRKDFPSYNEIIEGQQSDLIKLITLIHGYAVYDIRYADVENKLVKVVLSLAPLIKKIRATTCSETRGTYIQIAFCSLWPYLKKMLPEPNANEPLDDAEEGSDVNGCPDNNNKDNAGSFSEGDSLHENGSSTTGIQCGSMGKKKDSPFVKSGDLDDVSSLIFFSQRPNLHSSSVFGDESECEKVPLLDIDSLIEDARNDGINSDDLGGVVLTNISTLLNECEDNNFGETTIDYGTETRKADERLCLQAFDKALNLVAEKMEYLNSSTKKVNELIEFNNDLEFPLIHSGLKVKVSRVTDVDFPDLSIYDKYFNDVINPVAARLADEISQVPLNRHKGGKQKGYYSGKRINMPSYIRDDFKLFERIKAPTNFPTIAIEVILDESGSTKMGERSFFIRQFALIFLELARLLNIPIGIIGHEADCLVPTEVNSLTNKKAPKEKWVDVHLHVYADFEVDSIDKYRLMAVKPGSNNRDGYALCYGCERLLLQSADVKLCFMISDGKPHAKKNAYGGKTAERDLMQIKKKYEDQGIFVIAAAIGDDKDIIHRIYENNFLDISDNETIPEALANLLKEFYC